MGKKRARKRPARRRFSPLLVQCLLSLIVLTGALSIGSRCFAAHTFLVTNVSGLQVRAQLTVLLPDCANYAINWGDGNSTGTFFIFSSGTTSYFHTYAAAGTYNVNLICGGTPEPAQSVTVPPPGPDTTSPAVTITTPAADPFATAVPTVTLSGTASDNVSVTQVAWSNTTTGASGLAAGTTIWTAAGVLLQTGANNLVVTARDAAGNTGTDSITVNYAAPAGAFSVSPAPSSATAVPGRNNVLAVTYRASSAGSLTATSSQGTFETSGGSVLGTVDSTVTLRIVNGVGIAGESVTLPAAVIEAALDRSVNRIYYRRTFDGTVQTEVAFQVLPASAGPLSLKRMELNFLVPDEAGGVEKTPRATVPRNSGYLRAVADIQYDGGGTLRGVWKVDGQILGYTTRQLYRGIDTVAIESPPVPPLPTYTTGRHSVTFQIQDPPPGFTEPVIFYYVSEQAGGGIAAELVLIEPAPNAVVPMPSGSAKDPVFSWQSYPQQVVYRFEIVSPLNPKMPAVQAMTEQTRYSLSRYNSGQLLSNNDYRWRVVALVDGLPVAASSYRPIIFTVREGRPGGLSLSDFSVTDEAGTGIAGESGGPRPLFRVPADGPVRVSALLENSSGKEMKNVTVQVLVDGSLYDALFFPVLAPGEVQEVSTDLEPTGARQLTLQVRAFEEGNEGGAATIGGTFLAAAAADVGREVNVEDDTRELSFIATERLEMTGMGQNPFFIQTEELTMSGMGLIPLVIQTETLEITGLGFEPFFIQTEELAMSGMGLQPLVITTEALQMSGLGPLPYVITTDHLRMTGLDDGN